jgi:sugar phosphate isomerase/epimerase
MRYGAMNFPVLPVLEEIDAIAGMGFDYLELAMDAPMAHHSIIAADKTAIIHALEASGLGLICHMPTFVSTADLTESLRLASVTEMRRSLEVAFELGAAKIVLHPSMVAGLGAFVGDRIKAYAYDFLAEMVEAALQMRLTLCLESMFPRYMLGGQPTDLEEMFTAFPSLKLVLDTGHAHIDDRGEGRLLQLVEQFGSRIAHIHVSDNHGRRDEHLAVGHGTVDFAGLVQKLQAIGYDDTLTLEVFCENRQQLVDSRKRLEAMFAGSDRP